MKIKRIISLVIVLSILISAMPAFGKEYLDRYEYMDQIFRFDVGDFVAGSGDDAAAGGVDPEQEVIDFLDFLGIWDDAEANKNAHVTMTEFSIIISRLKLGVDNPLQGVYSANPDEAKVTYKEAYKQIITALGYYYMCEQHENPDEWILFVASQIDLLVSTPNNMEEYITRAELAKIITKALNIDLCVVEYTDYGYNYAVSEGKTLLNSVHDLHDVSGFVNAVYGLSVYSGNDCREGYIQIDRRNFKTSGLDLNHYLGRVVKAYASYDELRDEYSIVYIDYETEIDYIELNFADITDIENDTVYYLDENGLDCEISVGNLETIAENGKLLNSLSEMSSFTQNEGKLILSASEKYGDIDTAIIYTYTYAIVEYNDMLEHKIGLKNGQLYKGNNYVTIDEKAVNNIYLDDVKIDISALPANAAIRFFKNEATGYTEIIATTKTLIGEITSSDGEKYTIGEDWYRVSRDMQKLIEQHAADSSVPQSKKVKALELGLSTTFYVMDGVIIGYAAANEYMYGFLKSVTQARTGIDPDLTLKIFTQNGEWVELKVTKPIELDGQPNVEKEVVYQTIATEASLIQRTAQTKIIGNIVRFKANGDTLVGLDTIQESRFETDTDQDLTYNIYNTYDGTWTNDWLAMDYPYIITENSLVFAIPNDIDEEDLYSMSNNVSIQGIAGDGGTMSSHFFNTNELCEVGVVLIEGTINEIKGNQSSSTYYYVTKVMNAVIDADNQEYGYKVVAEKVSTGVAIGVAYPTVESTFYVSKSAFDKNPIVVGDFISASITGGKASGWKVELSQARVPAENSYETVSTTGFKAAGTIKALDAATDRVVLDIGQLTNENGNAIGQYHPILCRSKLIVNPNTKELTSTTLSGFHVGDRIYTYCNYGRAAYILKNVFD